MKRYGLLGEKLGHSFSPQIHAMLRGYPYQFYEVPKEELADFLQTTDLAGFNVTIPYKKDVMPFCQEISPLAAAIGSVNTVVRRPEGGWYADNTDYFGFRYMVQQSGVSVEGKKALVLGSGGASLAVRAALADMGAAVTVISRSGPDDYDHLDRHADASLLVNTTPLGMYPNNGESAVDLARLPQLELVLDLIYNPARTALMLQAERRGIPVYGGLSMLVAQAKKAGDIFTGEVQSDDVIPPIQETIEAETMNMALIGMPGCGKSTIGQRLAKATGRELIDLDARIEETAGTTIPEIFAAHGEDYFRKLETQVLAEVSKESGKILATGGGVVTRPENKDLLRQNSRIIFLKRDLNLLPTDGRPVSQSRRLEDILAQRLPAYESWSDLQVENDRTPEHTVERILAYFGVKKLVVGS